MITHKTCVLALEVTLPRLGAALADVVLAAEQPYVRGDRTLGEALSRAASEFALFCAVAGEAKAYARKEREAEQAEYN